MYDATGVRLQAGRQAEVWCCCYIWFLSMLPHSLPSTCVSFSNHVGKMACHKCFYWLIACLLQGSIFDWYVRISCLKLLDFYIFIVVKLDIVQVLNQIVYELPAEHPLAESRPLRELLGHTPPQVWYIARNFYTLVMRYLLPLEVFKSIFFTCIV